MRKRQHGTICYRPSASVMNRVLTVVAVALLGGAPQQSLPDAVAAGQIASVEALLQSGADVNAPDESGMTALMVAAFGGYVEPLRALLTAKADANAKDNQARTALMAAVTNGDSAVVQALIGAGADVAAADAGGGVVMTY